ncbi:unnamed protein product [Pleuronectes platessa]|uniref:Uncharacterized protein n=1 Tax=Pleuronectes platessa TaxID=8262 RepID=A0A9N7TWV4_PLEPL|nr:unnamed protein product [Pleuronectes platessa]
MSSSGTRLLLLCNSPAWLKRIRHSTHCQMRREWTGEEIKISGINTQLEFREWWWQGSGVTSVIISGVEDQSVGASALKGRRCLPHLASPVPSGAARGPEERGREGERDERDEVEIFRRENEEIEITALTDGSRRVSHRSQSQEVKDGAGSRTNVHVHSVCERTDQDSILYCGTRKDFSITTLPPAPVIAPGFRIHKHRVPLGAPAAATRPDLYLLLHDMRLRRQLVRSGFPACEKSNRLARRGRVTPALWVLPEKQVIVTRSRNLQHLLRRDSHELRESPFRDQLKKFPLNSAFPPPTLPDRCLPMTPLTAHLEGCSDIM